MKASGSKIERVLVSSDRKRFKRNDDDKSNTNSIIYLPNEIVDRIFTFLPIKHAISSSLVAKPFLTSWLYARHLCFDRAFRLNCSKRGRDEIPIINNIVSNHLGEKIHSFHIYIHDPTRYSLLFLAWTRYVASKGLEELVVHTIEPNVDFFHRLHAAFIDVETLRVLKLICCALYLPSEFKGLRFLKSLSLTKVRFVPYFIKRLFSCCVVLESLDLKACFFIGELTIKGSNKFQTLLIKGCRNIILITIDNPSITTFHYSGEINKIKFVHPTRLKDVILNFGATKGFQHLSEMDDLIEVLRNVQSLSFNHTLLEGFCPRYVEFEYKNLEYHFLNLKELQLVRRGLSFVNPWDILCFVKNCPQIQRLFLDFGNHAMEAGSYWNLVAKENFDKCQIDFPHLKLLKVKGFKKLDLEKKLVDSFLINARFLESVIIVESKNNCHEIKLSDFITVSKIATISIFGHHKDKSRVFPKHGVL
ncbi:putative FBD-associated F-box protein At1g61330 [Solanum dulcamara]|uniref:putative FBD-associated F-box protein At1g61330 n=1 Tax=Solanum dulcamara TaxID=45834 RepID=UPI0024851723|nr:putative FBD-associated F-box protein At1g61330 [Solanum dulcamara]